MGYNFIKDEDIGTPGFNIIDKKRLVVIHKLKINDNMNDEIK